MEITYAIVFTSIHFLNFIGHSGGKVGPPPCARIKRAGSLSCRNSIGLSEKLPPITKIGRVELFLPKNARQSIF